VSGRTHRNGIAPAMVPSPREPPQPRVRAYTVEEVADLLHVGRDKVYYLLRIGQLRSIKIGKSRRITEEHLTAFVAVLEDSADEFSSNQ
jgi:excisionase family DNA binding protein